MVTTPRISQQLTRRQVGITSRTQQISRTQRVQQQEKQRQTDIIEQQKKQLQQDVSQTIKDIEVGKITSLSQIPQEQRQHIDVTEKYFIERAEYQKQLSEYKSAQKEIQEWKQAEKLVSKGKGFAARGSPIYSKVKKLQEGGMQSMEDIAARNIKIKELGGGDFKAGLVILEQQLSGIKPTTSEIKYAQQQQQSQTIEDWKSGKITKEESITKVKQIMRGGGFGIAAQPEKWRKAQESIKKYKEKKIVTPDFKVDIMPLVDGTKETYMPQEGYYIRPSEVSGQATGYIRQPTPDERRIISEAEYAGSIGGMTTYGLKKGGEVIDWTGKKIEEFKETPIVKDVLGWEGWKSPEEVKKDLKYFDSLQVDKPIKDIMFKLETDKPKGIDSESIRWGAERIPYIKDIVKAKDIATEQAKGYIAFTTGFEDLTQEEKLIRIEEYKKAGGKVLEQDGTLFVPEPTLKVGVGSTYKEIPVTELGGKGIIGFGATIFTEKVSTTFEDIAKYIPKAPNLLGGEQVSWITPEQAGKGAGLVTELSLFTPQVVGELGEATVLGGEFGGPKTGIEFVKERPLEVATLATFGALGIWSKVVKGKHIRNIELISEPIKKDILFETKIVKETTKMPIVKPRFEVSKIDDVWKVIEVPKIKGRFVKEAYIPSAEQTGTFIEQRIIKGKLKTYRGKIEISGEGITKETIKYGDVTKVTTYDKYRMGTVELFKKGKRTFRQDIGEQTAPIFKSKRPKETKVIIDEQLGQPGIQTEEFIIKKGKKIKKDKRVTIGKDLLVAEKYPIETKLVKGELKEKTIIGEDIYAGLKIQKQEVSGYLDIIKVGERKGLIRRRKKDVDVIYKKRQTQQIEIGIDKTSDISLIGKKGERLFEKKLISPPTERSIIEYGGTKTWVSFEKPTAKKLKIIEKEAAKKKKIFDKKVAEIDKAMFKKEEEKYLSELWKMKKETGKERRGKITSLLRQLRKEKKVEVKVKDEGKLISEYTYGQPKGPQLQLSSKVYIQPTEELLKLKTIPTPTTTIFTGVKAEMLPRVGLLTKTIPSVSLVTAQLLLTKTEEEQRQKELQLYKVSEQEKIIQKEELVQKQELIQIQKTQQVQKLTQKQLQQQLQSKLKTQRQITQPRTIIKPKIKPKIIPPLLPGGQPGELMKKAKKILKQAGYHGEVKEKGKWKRVTKKPRTEQVARAIATKVADNTTSVSTRLIKTKKPAKKISKKLRANLHKFRDYSIRAGKKTKLPNMGLIEKKKARIDTPGEKKQLSVAKYMKTKEFIGLTKKKKKGRKKPKKVSFF